MSKLEFEITDQLEPVVRLDDETKLQLENAFARIYAQMAQFIAWVNDESVPEADRAPYKPAFDKLWGHISNYIDFLLFCGFTFDETRRILETPF
jgi:hypothetical protein